MKKHNGIISFWKFAFCLIILIFHVGEAAPKGHFILFKNGSIGVEFFFLVSGYFMAQKALKKNEKDETIGEETFHYVWGRFKSLFPYLLITYIVTLVTKTALGQMTIKDYVLSFWDISLLRFVGFKGANLINHAWYISAMFLCMAILYPQIKKYGKNYFYLIAPLSIIFIAGIMNHNFGNVREPHKWIGWMYKSFPRAYFEMALGSLLYPLAQKIKNIDFTKFGQTIFTLVEIGGLIIVIGASHFLKTVYDYILIIILAISVLLALSEKTLDFNFSNNKIFYYLEKLSLPMFLIHLPIRNVILEVWSQNGIAYNYSYLLVVVLIVSTIFSMLMIWFVDYLKKHDYFKPILKKLFIKEMVQE